MAILQNGSRGSEVRRLQELLNTQGYGLDVDGIFGSATTSAVKKYQKANGLAADGIVGGNTWGSLNALGSAQAAQNVTNPDQTAQTTPPTTATTPRGTNYDPAQLTDNQADLNAVEGGTPRFTQSQTLTDALNALQERLNQKPGAYESPYAAQIEALYNRATSRPAFQYDANADPLYQMYRDRYRENARQSMQDTMADAAALTGGYGNSYAQAAAQQAYDAQMNGLNDILPQLYGQAYTAWQNEGNDILQQLALAQQLDQTAYSRYADELADYYNQLDAQQSLANDMYNREYGEYADALQAWQNDRAYYYGKTADDLAQENYLNQLAMAASGGSSGGGGSSGRSGGSRSGGSSGGNAGTGANYKTVLATAKGLRAQQAYDYVERMADQGYITDDEGYRILAVELGLDVGQYAGGSGNTGNSGGTAMNNLNTLLSTIGQGVASNVQKALSSGATSTASKTSSSSAMPSHGTVGQLNTNAAKATMAGQMTKESQAKATESLLNAQTKAAQIVSDALKRLIKK